MKESLPSCSNEFVKGRIEWNRVLKITRNISEAAEIQKIKPEQVVLVGGVSVYLHAKKILGERATNMWRGTDDIDLIVTEKGGAFKISSELQRHKDVEFLQEKHSHFPNKAVWTIYNRSTGFFAGENRGVDVDVYFLDQKNWEAKFNERKISAYPNNFITEPVILTKISEIREKPSTVVAIPSVKDLLIMKTDIAGESGKLRSKDEYDILTLLMVAEKKGNGNSYNLLSEVLSNSEAEKSGAIKKSLIDTLSAVLDCYNIGKISADRKMFFPSENYLKKSRDKLISQNIGRLGK